MKKYLMIRRKQSKNEKNNFVKEQILKKKLKSLEKI